MLDLLIDDTAVQNQLKTVHAEVYPFFFQTLFAWYKVVADSGLDDPPNIEILLDAENDNRESYLHMLYDFAADSICLMEGWDDEDGYRQAYNVLEDTFENFLKELRHDVKMVFDFHQVFYGEGELKITEPSGQEYYVPKHHRNSPLQEVW